MALQIESIGQLQQYLNGVLDRANHHAENVREIALALLGAIIWRAEGQLRVREYRGRPANIIWFEVAGNTYAMGFNHRT